MYRKCMIRPLFKKYQKELLKFCNTDNGRSFLLDNWGGKADGQIIKVTPDSFHEVKDSYEDKLIVQATFFPHSPYIKKFADMLTYLDIMGQTDIPLNELGRYIYLTSPETFNPDADTETTSVDGFTRHLLTTDWATLRAAAGNGSTDTATNDNACRIYIDGTNFNFISRGIWLFDTSALPDSATISSAVFSLYGTDKGDVLSQSVGVVSSSPAINTAVAASDYAIANFGTATRYATDKTITSLSTSGYNDWTLNASGIAIVSKTGITKLATLMSGDIDNSAPSTTPNSNCYFNVYHSDNGSNKPKLVITYTLPTGGFIGIL